MRTGLEILNRIRTGDIKIEPFDGRLVNPNSVDLRLGPTMLEVLAPDRHDARTLATPDETREVLPDADGGWLLWPNRLYLGATLEYTETHNLIPVICGKSSVGRKGVFVHVTAGFGDVGFCGNWTLEILTVHPIKLFPGDRICQLHYHAPTGDCSVTYGERGRYQGDRAPSAAKPERINPNPTEAAE